MPRPERRMRKLLRVLSVPVWIDSPLPSRLPRAIRCSAGRSETVPSMVRRRDPVIVADKDEPDTLGLREAKYTPPCEGDGNIMAFTWGNRRDHIPSERC